MKKQKRKNRKLKSEVGISAFCLPLSALEESGKLFTPCAVTGSLLEAVNKAAENAVPGDLVLLSPACSSFDQFSARGVTGSLQLGEHRGDVFRQGVTKGGNANNVPVCVGTKQTMLENNFSFCFGVFEEKPRRNSTMNHQQRKDANQRQR